MKRTVTDMIIAALTAARERGELALASMPAVSVEEPKQAGHGDFATTVALSLARQEKKPPREIAEIIKKNVSDPEGAIAKIEIAGPGYLNFFLAEGAWHG